MTVEVPLYGRSGVIGQALVDDTDAELVQAYRWNIAGGGYAVSHSRLPEAGRSPLYMHRLILGLTESKDCTDHINGDKLDNRRCNLRVGTQALNNQNRGAQLHGTSRFRGVHYDRAQDRYVATVGVDGTQHTVGCFFREIDAARAADEMRRQVMRWAEPDPELAAYDHELDASEAA